MNKAKKDAAQAEEGRQVEATHLKEKAAEVVSLREALEREKQTSTDLKAASEEMMRKAEAEISDLKEQIPTLVSEARVQAVEFKISVEMRDLNVKFGQAAFIRGFELCKEKMVKKFPELDLSFLDEASEDGAGPLEAAAGLPLAGTPTAAATAAYLPRALSSSTSVPECPVEVLLLPQGIPLKFMIQNLRKEVRHLTKKSKKMEDELCRLRKSHSEATAEATRFRNLHVKGVMDYSRKKANFEKELEELQKRASD
uniref:Uncharacterized protein LOC114913355 n=2 Tax=Elaeis guineensis var. tenera TaxID=51953 RepID=A0A8N4EZ28_ELAGV|nr:uncharacterized protein LOC114913355 [Elaeis guineensis]